jgi:hypothetical protein
VPGNSQSAEQPGSNAEQKEDDSGMTTEMKDLVRQMENLRVSLVKQSQVFNQTRQLAYDMREEQLNRFGKRAIRAKPALKANQQTQPTINNIRNLISSEDDPIMVQIYREIEEEDIQLALSQDSSDDSDLVKVEIKDVRRRDGTKISLRLLSI